MLLKHLQPHDKKLRFWCLLFRYVRIGETFPLLNANLAHLVDPNKLPRRTGTRRCHRVSMMGHLNVVDDERKASEQRVIDA